MNPFIDECEPWPDHTTSAAQILRATIDNGMERVADEAADVIADVANELARAAVHNMPLGFCEDQDWIDGAAYAFAIMLGHLQHEMPLPQLQSLIEDIADEVAPEREDLE